ncbi:Alpha/Beta hydrolase protein [Umbelopsis sp. PMI_123]|nr:Alpha/Beta hydrolase protein [Umbelopsis sp. PMI_123]
MTLPESTTLVEISNHSNVKGKLLEGGLREFHIPYATVPKRWRKAQPYPLWEGTLDGRDQRPECPQPAQNYFARRQRVETVYDEFNCLNLDIIAPPASPDGSLYPCMFWIHGGALKNKSGGPDSYNATKLVQHSVAIGRPVVVVNVTYRLNAFGFFTSSDLKKDVEQDGEDVYGSWGIHDTRLAIQWVVQHIQHFGGDSNRLTGFGESAGGIILHHLLLLDNAPFKRAILQSGVSSVMPARPPFAFDKMWKRILDHYKATSVDDLRKIPADDLAQTLTDLNFEYTVVLDGAVNEDPLKKSKAPGAYPTLEALMIGDNTDEGTLWTRLGAEPTQNYRGNEAIIPADLLDKFHELYPPAALENKETALPMLDQIWGERLFLCPTERTVNAIVTDDSSKTKLYRYRLDRDLEVSRPFHLGKHHGADVSYVFLDERLSPQELEAGKVILSHWLAFAYGLDLEKEIGWKQYDNSTKLCMVYGQEQNEVKNIEHTKDAARYKFWEDVEDRNYALIKERATQLQKQKL